VLGGQRRINDVRSFDDLAYLRRDRGLCRGKSLCHDKSFRRGKREPAPLGDTSGSAGRDPVAGQRQRSDEPHLLRPIGATSAFDDQISDWKQQDMTKLTDPAVDGVGFSSPVLDSQGNAHVNFWATVGDTLIRVVEYAAATPDPAAAKALLQEQYDRIKNGLTPLGCACPSGQFRHS
jgi:hypothetical protein